jgi:hypothetical protein
LFTVFGSQAFQPMAGLLLARVEAAGISFPDDSPRRAAERLHDPVACHALAVAAGLTEVTVESEAIGYHLQDANEWWEIVWNSGYRGMLERLPLAQQHTLRTAHLAELVHCTTERGLWLNVETQFVRGRKPA